MRKEKPGPVEIHLVCDGCEYIIPGRDEDEVVTLTWVGEELHFCPPMDNGGQRHDCFQLFVLNRRVRERAARERGLPEIDFEVFRAVPEGK